MEMKLIEVRDGTAFVPVLAVRIEGDEDPLTAACGFSGKDKEGNPKVDILLTQLSSLNSRADPYGWPAVRPMMEAHVYIRDHWNEIANGGVVDIAFINEETGSPVASHFSR